MACVVKFVLFVIILTLCEAQIIKTGSCPNVKVVEDFDASKVNIKDVVKIFKNNSM